MLDKMIESKNDAAENSRRANFLLSTLLLVTMTFSGAMLYSLYAKPLNEMNGDFELSSLVAPVIATEPPPAELPRKESNNAPVTKAPAEITRVVNQKSIDESPDVPKVVSTGKNQFASRPAEGFKIGSTDSIVAGSKSGSARDGGSRENTTGIGDSTPNLIDDETKEPPKMPKAEPPQPQKPKQIASLGVVNGSAKNLPVPAYPPPAKAVHAQGAVNVQILIDETGKVISAKAVSGHPLLRQAAEQAAQRATFSPTLLSKVPVKASGVIVYNFVAQ